MPFIAWSLTGIFFLVRPRYEQAYETLAVRTYPLPTHTPSAAAEGWLELRRLRTVLGEHLIVKGADGSWQQLSPDDLQPRSLPAPTEVKALLEDAFSANPARYGKIESIDGNHFTTSTGVSISFDWDSLSFTQQGNDTRWINRIYNIHYLKWTGIAALDKVIGVLGLLLLAYMTYSGSRLVFGRPRPATPTSN